MKDGVCRHWDVLLQIGVTKPGLPDDLAVTRDGQVEPGRTVVPDYVWDIIPERFNELTVDARRRDDGIDHWSSPFCASSATTRTDGWPPRVGAPSVTSLALSLCV